MSTTKKVTDSALVVTGGSFATMVVAAVCGQEDVASVAATVFWGSLATAVGSWATGKVIDTVSGEDGAEA